MISYRTFYYFDVDIGVKREYTEHRGALPVDGWPGWITEVTDPWPGRLLLFYDL
jgi:hypothetical protein